jgi:DNA ligase 1
MQRSWMPSRWPLPATATLHARIARAYSLSADLGLVATTLLSRGADALDQTHPAPGYPVLSELAERLPSPQTIIERLGRALVEPKYDGLRLQAQKDGDHVRLFTRRLEDVTASFPDIARAVRSQVRAHSTILDGEAIGYDVQTGRFLSFQETIRRRRTHSVEQIAGNIPLRYFVFDVLLVDGVDSTTWPQYERSLHLHRILTTDQDQPDDAEQPLLHITPQHDISDPDELERFFLAMLDEGLEGVLAKQPDAPYHAGGRSFDWVKLKPEYRTGLADTFDLVVVGYDRGRGRRAALGIGCVLSAVYDLTRDRFRTVTRVGSGLSDIEWRRLRVQLDASRLPEQPQRVEATITPDVWVEPRIVLEVLAGGITRSPQHSAGRTGREPGYALRFPRIVRIRDDRRPEDATTEEELLRLAQLTNHARGDTS